MKSVVVKVKEVVDSHEAGNELVHKIKDKITLDKYSVGLIFCSSAIGRLEIVQVVNETLNIPVLGCTSSGEISDEGYSDDSVVLMVMTSDKDIFSHGIIEDILINDKDKLEKAIKEKYNIAKNKYNDDPSIMFIFPSFQGLNSIATIFNIINEEYRELAVFGGGSAIDFGSKDQEFLEFYNGKVYKGAMPYLFIKSEKKPIIAYENILDINRDIVGEITDYDSNIIKTIDNEPAYNFLKKTLGYDVSKSSIFFLYPSVIFKDGHHYSRVIIDVDKENGYLILGGTVENGGKISIQTVMVDEIERSTEKAIKDIMAKRDKDMKTVLCVSCECRKLISIFDKEQEANILNKYIEDDMSLIGFYSYGEITPLVNNDGESYNFYNNETISICVL